MASENFKSMQHILTYLLLMMIIPSAFGGYRSLCVGVGTALGIVLIWATGSWLIETRERKRDRYYLCRYRPVANFGDSGHGGLAVVLGWSGFALAPLTQLASILVAYIVVWYLIARTARMLEAAEQQALQRYAA